jgi:glycosyltransferase involved in cell wall biosynthesis
MLDWYHECTRRFSAETEEFGTDKAINRIQPKVSVCVATYQHEPFIRECLDNIVNQVTNFPFEVILGEDESIDGTRAICLEYARNHPDKIRLFLRSRQRSTYVEAGVARFFNGYWNCFSARGTYVALCEGDDYWTDSHKLQKQIDFLESRPDVSLCCHRVMMGTAPDAIGAKIYPDDPKPMINTLRDVIWGNWIPTCSMIMRREIAQEYPEWTWDVAFGDWPLQVLAAKRGNIGFIDAVMGFYRVRPDGRWSGLGNIPRFQDVLKFYFAIRGQVPSSAWNRSVRPRVADLKMRLSAEYAALGDFKAARREALGSLCADPRVALSRPVRFLRSFKKSAQPADGLP